MPKAALPGAMGFFDELHLQPAYSLISKVNRIAKLRLFYMQGPVASISYLCSCLHKGFTLIRKANPKVNTFKTGKPEYDTY
jgi:hypothetical protein